MSLSPYTGEWNDKVIAHLFRRTTYAHRKSHIQQALVDGFEETVNKVLTLNTATDKPLNFNFETDPQVAIGETWVNADYEFQPGLSRSRRDSLIAWIMKNSIADSISIQEKMTMFWHNHFVVDVTIKDARFLYRYYTLLRDNCLGDFRQLVKDVTIDPTMLRYLNGNQNKKQSPNENYARELLELFTIGKGPLVDEGDYTNYTEDDVRAFAQVLTGYVDTGHHGNNDADVGTAFLIYKHDKTDKQLSHRFDNVVISNEAEDEYKTLIDIILLQDEVSKFMVRNIYTWFVHSEITDEIETDIILPLAQIFRDNDYSVMSVIDVLLRSEHFFTGDHVGCMIKNPNDFMLNSFGQFVTDIEYLELDQKYKFWYDIFLGTNLLQMGIFTCPSVAGWKAYYQEPSFSRIWLNSVTLPLRSQFQDIYWLTGIKINNSLRVKLDPFGPLEWVSNPGDINVLVSEIAEFIFPRTLNEDQIAYLKDLILEGLPDFEWNVEYTEYITNPDDENLKLAIEDKLRALFVGMTRLPEYQLS